MVNGPKKGPKIASNKVAQQDVKKFEKYLEEGCKATVVKEGSITLSTRDQPNALHTALLLSLTLETEQSASPLELALVLPPYDLLRFAHQLLRELDPARRA